MQKEGIFCSLQIVAISRMIIGAGDRMDRSSKWRASHHGSMIKSSFLSLLNFVLCCNIRSSRSLKNGVLLGYRRFSVKHASCEMTMPQTLPQCCHGPTSPAGLLGVIIAAVTWHVIVPADLSLVTLTALICPQSVEQTSTTQ